MRRRPMNASFLRFGRRLLAVATLAAASAASAQTPTLTVVREISFAEGLAPTGDLVQHTDGALLGTAQQGGAGGVGTVFRVMPDGSGLAVLHSFSWGDGAFPMSRLTRGPDGAYYGTTQLGGLYGQGVIYRIAADGSGFSVVRNLLYPDGTFPVGGMTDGGDGWLYGVGRLGGVGLTNSGTVYRLRPDGSDFSVLHAFSDTDGREPYGSLLVGADGALYGTTFFGGAANSGTVFRVGRDGSGFAVLRHLGGADGERPFAGLAQAADGSLLGTASQGGAGGQGTVFRVSPNGTGFSVLHSFSGADGRSPYGTLLVRGSTVYGTTFRGGAIDLGTVFKLRPDGSGFTTVWDFQWNEPRDLFAGLIAGADGRLYGAAAGGFFPATGAVYALSDLLPPVITSATSAAGDAGAPFSYQITASNDPDDFDALGLPAGLSVSHVTGLISGTPTVAGVFDVTIAASNAAGEGIASLALTLRDATAPRFVSLASSLTELWPPNHRMVAIRLTATVTDNVDPAPSVRIVRVTSNEPVNGTGDGDTAPDWRITGPLTLELRAERAGGGNGRVYTITVAATDAAGNTAERTVTVAVPKSRGRG